MSNDIAKQAQKVVKTVCAGLSLPVAALQKMTDNYRRFLEDERARAVMHELAETQTKIVINNKFGGFGLSHEARKWLYERKSKLVRKLTVEEYFHAKEQREIWRSCKRRDEVYSYVTEIEEEGQTYLLSDDFGDRSYRSDPLLVECVETLRERASGDNASLKVVEVPADAQLGPELGITDYDGAETIREQHREWS